MKKDLNDSNLILQNFRIVNSSQASTASFSAKPVDSIDSNFSTIPTLVFLFSISSDANFTTHDHTAFP